jgi:hypothetical protein
MLKSSGVSSYSSLDVSFTAVAFVVVLDVIFAELFPEIAV